MSKVSQELGNTFTIFSPLKFFIHTQILNICNSKCCSQTDKFIFIQACSDPHRPLLDPKADLTVISLLQSCDLRWVGSAFDGRGATKNDWLLLKRITKPLCSSKKRPRKLRSGKSLKLDSTDRSNLIIN